MILSLRNLNRLLFVLALLGVVISGYLLEKYLTGGRILCGLDQGCEIVQKSQYSNFFGIPIPFFVVVYYLCFLCLIVLNTLYVIPNALYKKIVISASLVGVVISAVLLCIEIFVINAICLWCTISGVITLFLLILSSVFFIKERTCGTQVLSL